VRKKRGGKKKRGVVKLQHAESEQNNDIKIAKGGGEEGQNSRVNVGSS